MSSIRLLPLASAAAAVFLVLGCQQLDLGRAAAPPPTALEFVASDYSFTGPETLSSGLVTIRLTNQGHEPHHGQLLRLNDGVSLEEFMSTLQQDEQQAQALVSIEGGPGLIDPNGVAEVRVDLAPGTYLLACFVPSPDGVPHLAKGMLKPLQVVGYASAASASEPQVSASLTARDFAFEMPAELAAGRATYKVTNLGPQPHEVGVIKLAPGATLQDALAFYSAPGGPQPFQSIGGINGLGAGNSGFMTLDLQPGSYAAVCLIPDPSTGLAHVDLGMIHPFVVKG